MVNIQYWEPSTEKIEAQYFSEEDQIKMIKDSWENLKRIKNPTDYVIQLAIDSDGEAIRYVKNPAEEFQLYVLKKNIRNINYISENDFTDEVKDYIMSIHTDYIQYIDNPSEAHQIMAMNHDPEIYNYISDPCEKAQEILVKHSYRGIREIYQPAEYIQLVAVTADPDAYFEIMKPVSEIVTLKFIEVAAESERYLYDEEDTIEAVLYQDHFNPLVLHKLLSIAYTDKAKSMIKSHPDYKDMASIILQEMVKDD